MAGKLLLQTVGGKSGGLLTVDSSAGDLAALTGLMEGKYEQYDQKASGGTATAMPATLNRKKFSCGKKSDNYRCSFIIPHLKTTQNSNDVVAAVKAGFDANFDVTTKADYCNVLLAK